LLHQSVTLNQLKTADLVASQRLFLEDVELSPIAKRVLGYLEKDLTHTEIATLMGITRQAVGDTMRRYGITRKQLSKFRAKNDHQFKK
jgi:DNA-binding protein Fis